MFCGKCQRDLSDCDCPDLEERLLSVERFAWPRCVKCGKHEARCRCPRPEVRMVTGATRDAD